ncbi:glycosyltransferase [Flavobacterium acetivorans]|uniref:glycosyltransferase n=1 Tax=Flavobacterium acetivorans TaxID=2893883 RepID=UPI001E3640FF|nr:glycosyltransferase [Flavobacterium sp. F-29]UFH35766.1 glycosyltransferase [Flavobacterium sp. F-29]
MRSILIHAWTVNKSGNNYYLPYTHWVYLNEIVKYYDEVCLLSPVLINQAAKEKGLVSISCFENVSVIELPNASSYVHTIPHFFKYIKAYKNIAKYDVAYARYPVPFGWLQKVFMKGSKRTIHFVGDPIDTIRSNPNINKLKKFLLITFFMPEHLMYMWACRGASVYTNGFHIAKRLHKYSIDCKAMISSTLNEMDFYFDENKTRIGDAPKVLSVGYLRKAKGVETIINGFAIFQELYPKACLTIVGSGESETELKQLVFDLNVVNVVFAGHVDDRNQLNSLFRSHDIFAFGSLSEGSPRVILEAMANGLNVVSTPVGSLPYTFENSKDVLFADFNNAADFSEKMNYCVSEDSQVYTIRKNAFDKVTDYTIQKFLKTIFYDK